MSQAMLLLCARWPLLHHAPVGRRAPPPLAVSDAAVAEWLEAVPVFGALLSQDGKL
jgi:hypothetical protein